MLPILVEQHRLRRAALATSIAVIALLQSVVAAEIRIGGTGNAVGTMSLLADAYVASHPGAKITVLKSIGTSGATKAVAKSAIDIGLASRPTNADEDQTGLTSLEYARCATVFAVQERNRTTSLTVGQVAAVLRGDLSSWEDGTQIRPVLRQPGDDNTRQIRQLSTEIAAAVEIADRRQGMIVASTDQEAADKMESIPGSLGVSTIALIRSENRRLRALKLDGVEPSEENIRSGRYPLVKRFYFIHRKTASPDIGDFIRFVNSPAGRRVLQQTGHLLP